MGRLGIVISLPPINMEPDRGFWKSILLVWGPSGGFDVNWWEVPTFRGASKEKNTRWEVWWEFRCRLLVDREAKENNHFRTPS